MSEANLEEPGWVGEVLGFWFEELAREDWYRKSEALDEAVRNRFRGLYERIAASAPNAAEASARTVLAAVVVLDQFPRNMFRDTAQAFATDASALALAKAAIARGADQGLTFDQRHCLYLPFQHSEELADQNRACDLYEALGPLPPSQRRDGPHLHGGGIRLPERTRQQLLGRMVPRPGRCRPPALILF
jgi:uncharacterized protein (DUF924 family)